MNELRIRKIFPEDAEYCFETQHAQHFHERGLYSYDSWKFISQFLTDSWVASVDDQVVGHNIGIIQNLEDSLVPQEYHNLLAYNILDNCVHPDMRMSGVSGAIMDHVSESYPLIHTKIHADNQAAYHILTTRKFVVVNEVKDYYLDGGSMLVLVREG